MKRSKLRSARWLRGSVLAVAALLAASAGTASANAPTGPYYPYDPGPIGPQPIYLDDGSVYYPPDVPAEQGTNGELYDNTRAICDGQACNTGMESGDPDATAFGVEEEAGAGVSTEPPEGFVPPNPGAPSYQPIDKMFYNDGSFGNSTFGAGYTIRGTAHVNPAVSGRSAEFATAGTGRAFARIFGSQNDIAVVDAASSVNETTGATVGGRLFILGQQVFTATVNTYQPIYVNEGTSFNREFFRVRARFSIYGIGIDVTSAAAGSAGIRLFGPLALAGQLVEYTPSASAYVNSSASVNVFVASLGVEGQLTLLELSLPTKFNVSALSCGEIYFRLTAQRTLRSLSGFVRLFIKIKLFFIKKKKTLTIASWHGISSTSTLVDEKGQTAFGFLCSADFQSAIPFVRPPPEQPPAPEPDPYDDGCGYGGGGGRYKEIRHVCN